MSFEQPALLWLLAGAVPVVALHMMRWRRRRVTVSTLRFWEEGAGRERYRVWLSRLRDSGSLALNLAILAVLALGIAGLRIDGITHEPEQVLLLLDDGPSMAAEGSMERAVARLNEYWERATWNTDRVTVMTLSGRSIVDRAAAEGPPDLPRDVRFCRLTPGEVMSGIDSTGGFDRKVIFTDGADESAADPGWGVEVVGRGGNNAGFLGAELRGGRLYVKARNYSDVPMELRVGTETRNAEPGSDVEWVFPAPEDALVELRLEPADLFPLDQRLWVPIHQEEAVPVVVYFRDQINPFLWQVLSLLAEDGIVGKRYMQKADRFDPDALQGNVIAIFDDCDPPERLPAGRFLLIHPGRAPAPLEIGGTEERPPLAWLAPELSGTGWFHLRRSDTFRVKEGQEILVQSEKGPVAVRGKLGGSSYVALGFRLEDSDVQLTPVFPLLVRRSIQWLRDERLFPSEVDAGRPVRNLHPLGATSISVGARRLETADGGCWIPTHGLGVLSVRGPGFEEEVAVNFMEPGESDIRPRIRSGGPAWPVPRWWSDVPMIVFACVLALLLVLVEGLIWGYRAVSAGVR